MSRLFTISMICAFLSLAACASPTAMLSSNSPMGGTADEAGPPPTFAQFPDIPIPEKAEMDLERTLLLGSDAAWIGRLVFVAPYTPSGMFDFYMAEMPKFSWSEVTVVRADISVLTFENAGRVATIQLNKRGVGGTEVFFTVSPKGAK